TSARPYQPSVAWAVPAAPAINAANATVLVMRVVIFTPLKRYPLRLRSPRRSHSRQLRSRPSSGTSPITHVTKQAPFRTDSATNHGRPHRFPRFGSLPKSGAAKPQSPHRVKPFSVVFGGALDFCRPFGRRLNFLERNDLRLGKEWGRAPPDAAPSPHSPQSARDPRSCAGRPPRRDGGV